jgi:hypothetical protein
MGWVVAWYAIFLLDIGIVIAWVRCCDDRSWLEEREQFLKEALIR